MTLEKLSELREFLQKNHAKLYSKFAGNIVADADGMGVLPPKVHEDSYDEFVAIVNKWRDDNGV